MGGLVRVILVYKSGLGIFVSPLGAKLVFCSLNPNQAYRPHDENARLGVSEGTDDL